MAARRDTGMTLIELMVACLILSVVLLAAGSIVIGILTTQQTVAAVTRTATEAQAAATQIATGVRNASDLRLSTPTGTDQLLVVRTASNRATLTWNCRAWYYSASDGAIRTTVTTGARIASPTAVQLASWTVLVTDVEPRAGTGIFSLVPNGVDIAYAAQIDDGDPVVIETTAVKRSGVAEVGSCF